MFQTYTNPIRAVLFVFSLALLQWSCQKEETVIVSTPTTEFSAKLPQLWMVEAYNTVKRQGLFALDASRIYAYTAVSMYESMVHGIPNGRSLEGQLQGLNNLPKPDPNKQYNWGIVLCHTTPKMLRAITPSVSTETIDRIDKLAETQERSILTTDKLSDEVMKNSKEYGAALAQVLIKWALSDNRYELERLPYTHPSRVGNPQFWDPATLNQNFMLPFWWTSRPFVINSYRICEPEPPYAYSTDPSSLYYRDVKEVYDASFDPIKVRTGLYWANNPGVSGSPSGSWVGIANQLVDQYKLDITTTLKMYTLLTIGTRDVFISAWYSKYKWNLQRPVTYVREVLGQPNWNSPVPTPPYPDYLSGTSCNGGVSSATLTRLLGDNKAFEDQQHLDKNLGIRYYKSFREAGIEAYHSRIYGGVHMRRACELGFKHGQCVSDYVWENLKFEK
jgi:hypothetical protein